MAEIEDLPVPVYQNLEYVYGSGSPFEEAELRFDTVESKFVEIFGYYPDVYARSPGKNIVNIFLFFCFLYIVISNHSCEND